MAQEFERVKKENMELAILCDKYKYEQVIHTLN